MTRTFRPAVLALAACLALGVAVVEADARQRSPRSRAARQAAAETPPAEERREFAVSGGGTLDLSNVAGDVRITAERGSAVVVRAVRRATGRATADDLRALRVEMTQTGDRIEVRGRGPRSGRSRGTIEFTVSVPPQARVLARTISGHLSLTGVGGDSRVESVSGDVTVADAANVAVARTVSGDVALRASGSQGTLALGTVSGAVTATDVRAEAIDASSVSGSIRLTNVTAKRASAKTVSGDLEFAGPLSGGGRYEFTSHAGDVRLRLPGAAGFDLTAESFSGQLTSDFPVTLRSTRSSRTSRGLRGVAGDGGAQLVVRSFSGSVTIARQ
jgi:DUF4097 and DUF4098 domain-containing protein YvlB